MSDFEGTSLSTSIAPFEGATEVRAEGGTTLAAPPTTTKKRKSNSLFSRAALRGAAVASDPFQTWQSAGFQSANTSDPGTWSYEDSEAQEQRALSLALYRHLTSIDWRVLEPGNRLEPFEFIRNYSVYDRSATVRSLQSALSAQSPNLTDIVKASAIRSIGLLFEGDMAWVPFLITQLSDTSPSQAHAAALALGEVADRFSTPKLRDSLAKLKWPSAKKELQRTINVIEKRKTDE